ncbi:hypothetical protein [Shewanella woodyi]|uniref:Uncharacterized protein n=1 Tax=Shewanella woodyi (strain ATCC 51908 / MS32) TaxID=392500 RepID=B1KR14_SHEWM|nr:hypothetical protein [Shewanella woodyi]ACA84831.1 hypothetical protein Swoo_0535 [Shewanella woodyi ATCC 51908]
MKYVLKISSHLGIDLIESSEDELNEVKDAKSNILESVTLEEKLDLALTNYKEFEMFIASISIDYKMFKGGDWQGGMQKRRELARLFSNLLSSTRLYIDHLMHHVSRIYGKESDNYKLIKEHVSQHYDESLSYRLLETIRNHVQHAGLPISFKSMSTWNVERTHMVTIVTPTLMIEELRQNKRFKKSVLVEIESLTKSPDLKPHIRNYIGRLTQINGFVRELLNSDYQRWSELVLNCIEKGERLHLKASGSIHTALYCESDNYEVLEKIELFRDFLELREYFCQHNMVLDDFESRYVSTLPIDELRT